MSFTQSLDQYKSKYSCKVQNILLLSVYKDYKIIKKMRLKYTFSELYKNFNK